MKQQKREKIGVSVCACSGYRIIPTILQFPLVLHAKREVEIGGWGGGGGGVAKTANVLFICDDHHHHRNKKRTETCSSMKKSEHKN